MTKRVGQKIIAGIAGGAILGGAATYAATHKKQTGKILRKATNLTQSAYSQIDKLKKEGGAKKIVEGIAGGRAIRKKAKKRQINQSIKKGRARK